MTIEEKKHLVAALTTAMEALRNSLLADPLDEVALREARFHALAMVRYLDNAVKPAEHRRD